MTLVSASFLAGDSVTSRRSSWYLFCGPKGNIAYWEELVDDRKIECKNNDFIAFVRMVIQPWWLTVPLSHAEQRKSFEFEKHNFAVDDWNPKTSGEI